MGSAHGSLEDASASDQTERAWESIADISEKVGVGGSPPWLGNQKGSSRTGNDGFKITYPAGTVCRASISGWSLNQRQAECMGPWGPVLAEAEHP